MRGRKPQAAEIAQGKNNPGRRPLNVAAPKHPTIDPAIPDELRDARARDEWRRLVGALAAGHVTTVDRATLIGYCQKYAQWQTLEARLVEEGLVLVASRSKVSMPNPVLGMAHKAFVLVVKAAAELGITPSTRARIVVTPQPEGAVDEFASHQRRRLTLAKG
jgi:P27 family predicted phage terminase small subunit